ncbi:sugar phosphate isomerase/epimerase [Brevibacillus fluminis]|uniref:sugar phosphate isomerase/epimerase n=1 Tax=Brevibacillus fluminis TaxID=511487 RepID=UPI003F8C0DF2
MQRFLIGQYGGFDAKKQQRDFRDGFWGVEACMFHSDKDAKLLAEEAERGGFSVGVHYPFRQRDHGFRRDALFLSPDLHVRHAAMAQVEQELAELSMIKPRYVLFHYPKPVILDDRVNWEQWRFADPSEFISERAMSISAFQRGTEQLFRWLSEKGRHYQFTPVLEFDALNRYIYEDRFLEDLLTAYPAIKLCLDTGRLFMQELIDPYFQAEPVLRRYAKYSYLVHLWTVNRFDPVGSYHHPALPSCDPAAGWAPIERFMRIIGNENPQVHVLFEHRSDRITERELDACYAWCDSLLS